MLGNDIVDLNKAKADSNWKRKGYLAKIFSESEQLQILSSKHPEQLIWLLWSMKEATYKIINRERLERFYSPKKFDCKLNEGYGVVNFEDRIFYTQSEISKNSIHTIASTKKEDLTLIKTYFSENKQDYVSEFNTKSNPYAIEKSACGIPYLVDKKTSKKYDASISHHGKYLAIIYPTS